MNRLKKLRKKHHLKQSDVANYLKITQPNYSNFETGKIKLNMEYAKLLSILYKVPVSYIIDDHDEYVFLSKEEFEILKKAEEVIKKIQHRYNWLLPVHFLIKVVFVNRIYKRYRKEFTTFMKKRKRKELEPALLTLKIVAIILEIIMTISKIILSLI